MDPRDPIAQSLEYDFSQGLQDASRAQTILKMLPRLVTEQPQLRNIQATSGLPQSGQEALADTAAISGQFPSGTTGDTRMGGGGLGAIYQKRAGQRIEADTAANQAELERTRQANAMNIAQARQGTEALDFVQRDRQIAQQIKVNERLLAQDARMRIEFIMEQGKRAGPVDSEAFQAYSANVMRAMRDPARRQALLDPQTGVQAMISLIDEGFAAAPGGAPAPPGGAPAPPSGPPVPPRAEAALGVTGRMAGIPDTAPAGQPAWSIAPAEQAARDQRSQQIVQAERTALPGQDPAAAAAAAIVTPTPPRPFRPIGRQEGAAAYEAKKQTFDQAEETRYREEIKLFRDEQKALRDEQKDAKKQELEQQETIALYRATASSLDEAIANAETLLEHKGLDNITGGLAGVRARTPDITAEARAARSLMDTVMAKGFLDSLMNMKSASKTGASGFGQLSEKEGAIIRASIGNLDPKQDTADFKDALNKYIDKLKGWRSRAEETYRDSPYYVPTNAPPTGSGGKAMGGVIKFGDLAR